MPVTTLQQCGEARQYISSVPSKTVQLRFYELADGIGNSDKVSQTELLELLAFTADPAFACSTNNNSQLTVAYHNSYTSQTCDENCRDSNAIRYRTLVLTIHRYNVCLKACPVQPLAPPLLTSDGDTNGPYDDRYEYAPSESDKPQPGGGRAFKVFHEE
jgi:hypothetical protein